MNRHIANKLLVTGVGVLLLAGCGKESSGPGTGGGMATQGAAPELTPAEAEVATELATLTRELKRHVVSTKKRPNSFEEFVAEAKVTVPPAPAGKKFALSKELRVVLVDQ